MKHIKPFVDNIDVSTESKTGDAVASSLVNLFDTIMDATSGRSLTSVTKKTLVSSTVYVDTTLVDEDVTLQVLKTLNTLFISYVLTALSLYNLVDGYKEISDTIGRVATEVLRAYRKREATDIKDIVEVATEAAKGKSSTNKIGGGDFKIVDAVNKNLAIGKLIMFTFKLDRDGSPVLITVPIMIQLLPTNMEPDVINAIISLNFTDGLVKRFYKVRTGEIRFFRDFILGLDLAKKHADALKADYDNTLSKFYSNKLTKRFKYIKGILTGKHHNNVASSMFVIDKEVFDQATKDASLNFDNYKDRQEFFNVSYAMIIVVVDRMSEIVDIYYNGLKSTTEVTFRSLSSKGEVTITDMMQAIAKGTAPKL